MKKNLYIFRHGETDYNVEKRMQGCLDIPLNANGIAQAQQLAQKLSNIKFDCVFSSPLSRALETAKIAIKNCKIITDDKLQEWNLGIFCGKIIHATDEPANTPVDMTQDIINVPLALLSDDDYIPDGGESHNMFKQRINDAIIHIAKNTDAENIGIATHGGVIRFLVKRFGDFKYPKNGIPNAEYLTMQWDGNRLCIPKKPDWA